MKEALVRKFGQQWFDELDKVAKELKIIILPIKTRVSRLFFSCLQGFNSCFIGFNLLIYSVLKTYIN